jgi:hypothetical protein
MVLYFIHAVDGQVYGPVDLNGINQWIAEGRVVPTTLLQPENTQIRVAASTVTGLTWGAGQTYQAYTPQKIDLGFNELRASWVCFGASVVLCCMSEGFHLMAGFFGIATAVVAYRKGRMIALAPLLLNLILLSLFAMNKFGTVSFPNTDQLRERFPQLEKLPKF